ncbi:PAS domain-containing protein [Desulfuromonas sp.]|uniref:PAS domain-containing protein n=1 Tax=Desulfuromonas sp. TaxID=892 RepID=UPI0025C18F5C|nr:PAS domain-containing protein [Desulfuromonas sp.]
MKTTTAIKTAARPETGPQATDDLQGRRPDEQTTALREYSRAVESSQDLIAVINRQLRYSLVNEAWLKVHGRDRNQVIDCPVEEVLGETLFREQVRPRLEKCFRGESLQFEVSIPHPRHGLLHLHTRYTPVFGGDGSVEAVTVIIRDFTALKNAEEGRRLALAEAEEKGARISAILASIGDGLIVTDLQGRIVLLNQVARDLFGLSGPALESHPPASDLGSPALAEQIGRILADETCSAAADLKVTDTITGAPRILQARSTPSRNKKDEMTGAVTIVQDVTRERELDRMKKRFISIAAHELSTPLTAVIGFSELLLNEASPESTEAEYLQIILDKAHNLARTADDLLDINRITAGQLITIDRRPCDIGKMISETIDQCRMNHPEKHRFEFCLSAPPPVLSADERRIAQALENILGNAVKYSPAGGTIRLTGAVVSGHYQVSIRDEGIGMTPEQASRAFDHFYRGNPSDSTATGLGIGLALVKSIVELHDGTTWIESEPGVGTQVAFTLPMDQAGD